MRDVRLEAGMSNSRVRRWRRGDPNGGCIPDDGRRLVPGVGNSRPEGVGTRGVIAAQSGRADGELCGDGGGGDGNGGGEGGEGGDGSVVVGESGGWRRRRQ